MNQLLNPQVLCIVGTSMKPNLLPGDYVTIEPAALAKTVPGDMIIVHIRNTDGHNGRFCAHRLLWRTARTMVLKGDGISSFNRFRLGHDADYSGRVTGIIRNNNVLSPSNRWENLAKLLMSIGLIPWHLIRRR